MPGNNVEGALTALRGVDELKLVKVVTPGLELISPVKQGAASLQPAM